jgi:hypothetical protein
LPLHFADHAADLALARKLAMALAKHMWLALLQLYRAR